MRRTPRSSRVALVSAGFALVVIGASGCSTAGPEGASWPRMFFTAPEVQVPHANAIRFRLGPDDGVALSVQAKRPGQDLATQAIDLNGDFNEALGERQEPYERLLDDALDGDTRRFARQDGVENVWRVVQPALDALTVIQPYERGTWGPPEADARLRGGHWAAPAKPVRMRGVSL